MNILITGSTGLLGPHLMEAFSRIGNVTGVARSKSDFDCELTSVAQVKNMLSKTYPDMIVHSAAMTDVDACARDPEMAVLQNCTTTENLVRFMHGDCRFIYISTDQIYSGLGPHKEHSKSENPLNSYGLSKFMGEFAAARARNYLNIRTNFYCTSKSGRGLVEFLMGKMRKGEPFPVFTDLFFSPIWAPSLASRLVTMAKSSRTGTFNLGASTGMSKAKFAMLLANELSLNSNGARPIPSAELKGRTIRPLDTRMETHRTESSFGFSVPSMEVDIKNMCGNYKCAN